MKKLWINKISVLIGAILILGACKKPKQQEDPKPDGQALHESFMQHREDLLQTFTIDASTGGTITGSEGTVITFPPNAFGSVSGNVEIELIELYDRAGMLLSNRPTNGVKPNGDVEIMKSKGSLYINAKQGVNILELVDPITIKTRGENDPGAPVMFVLDGGRNQDATGDWELLDEDNDGHEDMVQPRDTAVGQGGETFYIFDRNNLGWTNLDKWYSYSGPKTQLWVDVPDGYDDSNCEVYLMYEGEPGALARMDVYDDTQGMFTEHYGYIPIGINVHLVMVTEIDGTLYASMKTGITIVNNHVEVMPDPQPTTQQDLENAINALP